MKKLTGKKMSFHLIDQKTVRLIVSIVCLILFVLAAGAPGGLGGIGMQSADDINPADYCHMSLNAKSQISLNALEQMSKQSPVRFCMP